MTKKINDAGPLDEKQHIIVIGASSGGFEALKKIAKGLPPGFGPPIMVVWHMSPDIRGVPHLRGKYSVRMICYLRAF